MTKRLSKKGITESIAIALNVMIAVDPTATQLMAESIIEIMDEDGYITFGEDEEKPEA